MATEPVTGIIQWGYKYLSSHGYALKSNVPEDVQSTPWSYVVRFAHIHDAKTNDPLKQFYRDEK